MLKNEQIRRSLAQFLINSKYSGKQTPKYDRSLS